MPPCKYPVNAFSPHGHFVGLEIGANADAERYCLVLDARYKVRAPWPPML